MRLRVLTYNPPLLLLAWVATAQVQIHGIEAHIGYLDTIPPLVLARVQIGSLNIGANEGRLHADLRELARHSNPVESLCMEAAVFDTTGNATEGNALADLSVTGRRVLGKSSDGGFSGFEFRTIFSSINLKRR